MFQTFQYGCESYKRVSLLHLFLNIVCTFGSVVEKANVVSMGPFIGAMRTEGRGGLAQSRVFDWPASECPEGEMPLFEMIPPG